MIIRTTLLALASLGCLGLRHAPPDAVVTARVTAFKEVLNYRRLALNDTSLFQTCDVTRALGTSIGEASLAPHQRSMLDQPTGCDANGPLPRGRGEIQMNTIVVTDSGASVRLAVAHGEYFHLETYTVKSQGARTWVDSVLLSSASVGELREPNPPRRP